MGLIDLRLGLYLGLFYGLVHDPLCGDLGIGKFRFQIGFELGRLRAGPGRAVQIIPDLVPAVIHDLQHRLIAEMRQNGNENDKVED